VFVLDTNACIRFLNGTSQVLIERVRDCRPSELALCSVVKAELIFGAQHSGRVEENLETLREFFSPFISFPFDDEAARHYGEIRCELSSRGELIGPNDLLIAATARANDAILITHNTGEFSRVSNLRIEDWELED
jgi:tRNA(fMet)-specific endonuclease VapC